MHSVKKKFALKSCFSEVGNRISCDIYCRRESLLVSGQICFLKWNSHPCSFRLIVIAEKDVVYNKFPIPLINRLEKHYLVTLTSLTPDQMELVDKLKSWVSDFSEVRRENKRNR